MPISISELAKKLDIAPEAVQLHAMDLDFEIPDDEILPDEIAAKIRKIELGDEISQTEHKLEDELDREIVDEQQKKTAGSHKKIARKKAEKDKKEKPAEPEKIEIKKTDDGTIILPDEMTVRELSVKIGKPLPFVLVKMKQNGIIANLKENIDFDTAGIIASELGVKVKKESAELSGEDLFRGNLKDLLADEETENLVARPPVISIMGHVDHGKTSILDFIRKTKIAAGESGGITQRIGAYQISTKFGELTFLDTPGHEAFTAMRARGAQATDIAILVVAATEGLKPQSLEAIAHAKNAEIPIIVAINKIDLDGANPDKIKKELAEKNLNPEEWGGETPTIEVSAKTGAGIEKLLETISAVAEIQELKANPKRTAIGTIIESQCDVRAGIFATVLINTGSLRVGDVFVIYDQFGKIRTMKNFASEKISVAGPSTPVQISGISKLPKIGDLLQVVKNEKIARKKAAEVADISHEDFLKKRKKISLATLKMNFAEKKMHQLKILAKTDSDGTREAVVSEIENLKTENAKTKIIFSGVGEISESDVNLAAAGDAIIVGFDVKLPPRIKKIAEKFGVEIFIFDVIYHLTEKISEILAGGIEKKEEEKIVGEFKIKKIFASNKKMAVLGGEIFSGKIRVSRARVFRGDEKKLIGEIKIESVQIGQKVVGEVSATTECGAKISHSEIIFAENDVLEIFSRSKK